MISPSGVDRARARRRLGLERRLLLSTRRQERESPESAGLPDWEVLTRRSVALCRRDRALWSACMDRADALESRGAEGRAALLQALEEAGA